MIEYDIEFQKTKEETLIEELERLREELERVSTELKTTKQELASTKNAVQAREALLRAKEQPESEENEKFNSLLRNIFYIIVASSILAFGYFLYKKFMNGVLGEICKGADNKDFLNKISSLLPSVTRSVSKNLDTPLSR